MRRLLQAGTFLLVLSAFISPLLEYFDRWDSPGLSNDTELALFAVLVVLCLVLLLSLLISRRAADVAMSTERVPFEADGSAMIMSARKTAFVVQPMSSPPLLISLRI